ncbi:MAG: hypothetical protein PUA84_02215 [Oscillospiraceae bacterium]|nr:hypothetical protein [Oscillospiraceae bacterium]
MIQLKEQGKFIDTKAMEMLLTQGEKYSDLIQITIGAENNNVDISDCTFVIRAVASDGSMSETVLPKTILENEVQLLWEISESVTAVPGMLSLELIGSKGSERIIKYKMPAIYVKEAVMGEGLPVPDIMEEKLALMNETLSKATELQKESETLHNESQDLQRRTEELAEQIVVSSEYVSEVTAARTASKTVGTYSTLSERLAADFDECITDGQLYVVLENEIGKAREEWQADIANALGTVENGLAEVVSLSENTEVTE